MKNEFIVRADWDDEAGVWVATSDDIPGLVTEAATLDALQQRILAIAPDLLEENAHLIHDDTAPDGPINVCMLSKFSADGRHAA